MYVEAKLENLCRRRLGKDKEKGNDCSFFRRGFTKAPMIFFYDRVSIQLINFQIDHRKQKKNYFVSKFAFMRIKYFVYSFLVYSYQIR